MKEGKIGRKDGQPLPGEDEPLHAYVTANNPENVIKAVEKVFCQFSCRTTFCFFKGWAAHIKANQILSWQSLLDL